MLLGQLTHQLFNRFPAEKNLNVKLISQDTFKLLLPSLLLLSSWYVLRGCKLDLLIASFLHLQLSPEGPPFPARSGESQVTVASQKVTVRAKKWLMLLDPSSATFKYNMSKPETKKARVTQGCYGAGIVASI